MQRKSVHLPIRNYYFLESQLVVEKKIIFHPPLESYVDLFYFILDLEGLLESDFVCEQNKNLFI